MDAAELARWTRFAAKGGIGKCTATHDCVAESPEDLMFLKDDEITVLMQLPEEDGLYLGYCEGVVGRFQGIHVHFHSKLKKPVMTKRASSLSTTGKSPTPTLKSPSPHSMLGHPPLRRASTNPTPQHSRPPTDDESVPALMANSSSSTLSDAALITPPLHQHHTYTESHQKFHNSDVPSLPLLTSQIGSPPNTNTNTTPPLAISPERTEDLTPVVPSPPPTPPSPAASQFHDEEPSFLGMEEDPSTRISVAMSDGEVGIGLSLLQDLANGDDADDWSSTGSRYSTRSLVQTPDNLEAEAEDEKEEEEEEEHEEEQEEEDVTQTTPQGSYSHSTPSPSVSRHDSFLDERRSLAPSSSSTKRSELGEDWEGASDIYDDYRYSRFSMASKMSRFSQASHPSNVMPPPVPDARPRPERSMSNDSEASIYTQSSKLSGLSAHAASLLPPIQPNLAVKGRPSPLDLNPSPLLHTRWGSPVSSAADVYSPSSFFSPSAASPTFPSASTSTAGIASALRQRIEVDRPSPSPQPVNVEQTDPESPRRIVIEDDEDSHIHVTESEPSDRSVPNSPASSTASSPRRPRRALAPLRVANRSPSPPASLPALASLVINTPPETASASPSQSEVESPSSGLSPSEVAPPPPPSPSIPPSPSTARIPRPSLSELRGYESSADPAQRTSLFLPHPNAPKPTASSAGPMYIRAPMPNPIPIPNPNQLNPNSNTNIYSSPNPIMQPNPAANAANILRMAMGSAPRQRGPTIYGRVEHDLASSTGPVPILFSVDPPAPPPPPVVVIVPKTSPLRTAVVPEPSTAPAVEEGIDAKAESSDDGNGGNSNGSVNVIPRANFFPKAATARPRSRSFSGFNSTPAAGATDLQRSREEGSQSITNEKDSIATLGVPTTRPTSPSSSRSSSSPSPSQSPALNRPSSSSKLRISHAPSPLSLPHNNSAVPLGMRPPAIASVPPSPTTTRPSQLRHVSSPSPLNETPVSTVVGRTLGSRTSSDSPAATPNVLRKQRSYQAVSGRTSITHSRNDTGESLSLPIKRPSMDVDNTSLTNSRSQVVSPTPGRRPSLRTKMSMPNLGRHQSRHGSIGSGSQGPGESETVQVEDMDFELVRPNMIQIHSRTSEDSSIMGREGSIDVGSDFNSNFLRADSPAVTMSSGQRSPTVSEMSGSWPKPTKASDSETNMDAHRQRELKWVSIMSSVPASQSRKNKRVKKLLLEGVPSSVRYLVWSHIMDGKARGVPGVYAQLGQRARVTAFGDIERDVQRCFSDHPQLLSTQGPLLSLLQAYLTMVPDIKYTTGLTLISGHLLLLSPEEDAFWVFVSIMDTYLRPYFSSNTTQMEVDAALFSRALESNDAQVAKKLLTDLGISPVQICYPWFSTLFVGTLPTEYLNRVWDMFLFEGIPFLIRVGLVLMHCCRRAILEFSSEESILNCLKRPSAHWLPATPEAFISLVLAVRLKDDAVRKQRTKMEAQVKRQTQTTRMMSNAPISLPRS